MHFPIHWWILATLAATQIFALRATGQDATINDISQVLATQESIFKDYCVRIHYDGMRLANTNREEPVTIDEYVVCRSGNMRCEATERVVENGHARVLSSVSAFDGIQSRRVIGDGQRWSGGVIASGYAAFEMHTNPRNFVLSFQDEPIHALLARRHGHLDTDANWNGDKVTRITFGPHVTAKHESRIQFILHPKLNFTPVQKTIHIRLRKNDDWKLVSSIDASSHVKHSSGLWLPRQGTHEFNSISSDGVVRRAFSCSVTFSDWNLAPDATAPHFKLRFPVGILVEDRVAGRTFIAGKVTDQGIADQVAYSFTTPPTPPSRTRLALWSTLAAILLGVGLLIALRVRSYKSPRQ